MKNIDKWTSVYYCWCRKINRLVFRTDFFHGWLILNGRWLKKNIILQKINQGISLKGNQQGPKNWFLLDIKWLKTKFRTGETNFYKSLFQKKLPGQADSTKLVFHVPIGSAESQKWLNFIHMYLG